MVSGLGTPPAQIQLPAPTWPPPSPRRSSALVKECHKLTEHGAKCAATGHQTPLRAADSTWSFLPYKALKGLIKDSFILKLLKGASDKAESAIPASL